MITRGSPEAERLPVTISRTSHPSADKTNKGNCLSLLNQGDVIRRCGPRPGAPQHCREQRVPADPGDGGADPTAFSWKGAASKQHAAVLRREEEPREGQLSPALSISHTLRGHHRAGTAGAELGAVGATLKAEPEDCSHPFTPVAHKWDGLSCAPSLCSLWVPAGPV